MLRVIDMHQFPYARARSRFIRISPRWGEVIARTFLDREKKERRTTEYKENAFISIQKHKKQWCVRRH